MEEAQRKEEFKYKILSITEWYDAFTALPFIIILDRKLLFISEWYIYRLKKYRAI